jgi:hypothetical protein
VNAEEENEELHQAIDEPFSVKVHNLCNEKIELEYRIMSLKDALFGDLGIDRVSYCGGAPPSRLPARHGFAAGNSDACRAQSASAVRGQVRPGIVRKDSASPSRMIADRAS